MMIRITRTTPYAALSVDFDPHGDVHLPQVLREMDKVANTIERREVLASDVRSAVGRLDYAQRTKAAAEIPALESALAEAEARLAEVEG